MTKTEKICHILAALSLALGLLLRFVFTAVRFTGFLFCCAAAALEVFALLTRWRGNHRWALWLRRAFLLLLAAGFLYFAVLEVWVISWARTDTQTAPQAVVVLGAGVNGRTPSLSLQVRLEAALAYIADRPDVPVVVTGAQGRGEAVSEAACMADWLTARGVPPERILLEEQATTTEENVRYTKALLEERGIPEGAAVAVVTSDYHLCRAAWLWGPGMIPVAAGMPARYLPLTVNYYVREAFGMAAAMVFG